MKRLIPLFIFCVLANYALAQGNVDSLQQNIDQATTLPEMPDSLKASWQRVDSVRQGFNHEVDSLNQAYTQALNPIEAERAKINHQIDSLNSLGLPPGKLTNKLDSLNQEKQKLQNNLNGKLDKAKSKTIGKLSQIEMTPEMQGPVSEFTQKVNGYTVTDQGLAKLAPIEVPGYSLPEVKGIEGLNGISGLKDIGNIDTPLGNVTEVSKQVGGLGEDVKNISQGNLNEVKQVPQTIEQQATRVEGISELQESTQVVDGYKEKLEVIKSEDALKQEGANMVKKEAINHFAGKEKELKAAMDKLSGLKKKYSSVQSIHDLPKRPPNAMKGKPFIERLVPGLWLQFQIKDNWVMDVNPYAGYRISGRFTSGLGWNHRVVFDNDARKFIGHHNRVYGPRAFVDANLGRGFIGHLEQEALSTFVPYKPHASPDEGSREWVWSTMLGIKKQYKIYKNLRGTVLIQYNLYNPHFRAPYLDKLVSRMGFEYALKKKPKKDRTKEGEAGK